MTTKAIFAKSGDSWGSIAETNRVKSFNSIGLAKVINKSVASVFKVYKNIRLPINDKTKKA
jgi:hypothetical protein